MWLEDKKILEVENLKKYYEINLGGILFKKTAFVKAVDDVSFSMDARETVGLVGESGRGKTTLGRTVLRLVEPTDGHIFFKGSDLIASDDSEMQKYRRNMQIVFQDPISSLNPRMKVEDIIGEPLVIHKIAERNEIKNKVGDLLTLVGLNKDHMKRYPHEFSGGQKQRISIARALISNPEFLVLDEPTSALDVSVQAQVLNLLRRLQEELGLTYLFISHNLNVVQYMSDRIMVMYLGKIVESGKSEDIFDPDTPHHPYTLGLATANPIPDPDHKRTRIALKGEVPSSINPPSGCRFHPRCPFAQESCASEEPPLKVIDMDHLIACEWAHYQ